MATATKTKAKATNGKAKKAKPAKAEKPAKTLSEIQQEHYEQIKLKERDVATLESEYLVLKEQTKDAKALFEEADHALRRLINQGPDAQRKLPFQDNPPVQEPARVKVLRELKIPKVTEGQEFDVLKIEKHKKGDGFDVLVAAGMEDDWLEVGVDCEVIAWKPAANPDAWKATPLADILKGENLARLADAGLKTIGELSDYTASNKRLTDIKDIGPESEAKISDAVAEWFAKHPEHCESKPEPKKKISGQKA